MSGKPVVAAGTVLLLGAIGYSNVYLPFYSDHGKARRDEYAKTGKVSAPAAPSAGTEATELNKKSMWAQLDRGVKGAQQGHSKPPATSPQAPPAAATSATSVPTPRFQSDR